jgi:hypothetical protein
MSLLNVYADDNYSAVRTSVDNGRYEIVQSEIMRRLIFLLDKYTGDVYQNLLSTKDERVWRKLKKAGSSNDVTPQTQINYQLFVGGFSVQDIFLLNINTGETWYIFKDTETEMLFFSKSYADSDI